MNPPVKSPVKPSVKSIAKPPAKSPAKPPAKPPVKSIVGAALVLMAVLSLPYGASADEADDLDAFKTANQLYDEQSYEEAAQSYQRLVGLGSEDATLYYNLANAHYKTGDLGRAILNYTRARRLAPFDEDIAANLALAMREAETSTYEREPVPALAQLAEQTPFDLAVQLAALGCWLALGATAAAWVWSRRARASPALRRTAAALAVCAALAGSLAVGDYLAVRHWESVGIVTAESADVFSGPGSRYAARFSIGAGHEVRILESRGGWSKVAVPRSDLEGWIQASDAETVLPAEWRAAKPRL